MGPDLFHALSHEVGAVEICRDTAGAMAARKGGAGFCGNAQRLVLKAPANARCKSTARHKHKDFTNLLGDHFTEKVYICPNLYLMINRFRTVITRLRTLMTHI